MNDLEREIDMAFGEQKKKKPAFEVLTKVVIILMLTVTVLGIIASAVSALM